jgi:hypothetical protein
MGEEGQAAAVASADLDGLGGTGMASVHGDACALLGTSGNLQAAAAWQQQQQAGWSVDWVNK